MKNEYSSLPPDLTRIERKVLSLRFGKGMRLIDIAAELKMSEERVLIMERKALKKIMKEAGI